ncbi:MAG TPA: S8 family peptidase, partial [Myxococcaceae bacterium]|nr:S8 family peptidase [Myxococcaceae bacterium]
FTCCLTLASCAPGPELEGLEEPGGERRELVTTAKFLRSAKPLAGQYIVVLAEPGPGAARVSELAPGLAQRYGASVQHVYEHALRGFSARMTEAQARALAADPSVRYVEEDGEVHALAAPPHLDRIDQRDLPLDGAFTLGMTGAGVNAYVIDTGIRMTHTEFGGRALTAFSSINDGRGASDCNGHGTAVASLLGGTTYGVAKGVRLHSVRVLDCNGTGSISGVIAGVDWVTANHSKPAVANMSLGGISSSAFDNAVLNSIQSGVPYVASMGSNGGVCDTSPARIPEVISVGASSVSDSVVPMGNQGPCLDLYAPGLSITSAWHTSDSATYTVHGTSYAAAQVSGTIAAGLQMGLPASLVVTNATKDRLSGVPDGTANLLLYTGYIGQRLSNGVTLAEGSHGQYDQRYHVLSVPSGMSRLDVKISGGTGDADLYVRAGSPPTLSAYNCRPYVGGSTESCTLLNPRAGDWYAMIRGYNAYAGLSLTAWYSKALAHGVAHTGMSGSLGSQQFWAVEVPAGSPSLTVTIEGGTGDADLYVRHGEHPSLTSYDCRPYVGGNSESCTLTNPAAGTWFVMLRGWSDYSGVTLRAQY